MRTASNFNPLNWTVEAGRSAVQTKADWNLIGTRFGLLGVLLAICLAVATRAFRSYQRSV